MPPLPAVSGAQVVQALEKSGFEVVRVSGSHHRMAHADGRRVSVPVHRGRGVAKGTLRSIIRDVRMTVPEFVSLLG